MPQQIDSLEMLLHEELKDIYDAEKQLTKALPKMVKAASSDELQSALEEHLEVTKQQVSRLERVFELLGKPAKARPCMGMRGLVEEGKEVMEKDAEEVFLDAAIIGAAQKVEHYEIAAYGTVRTFAQMLGNDEVANLLEQTLNEEKEADERLTEISESMLQAHSEQGEEEGEEYMEQDEEEPPRRRTAQAGTRAQAGSKPKGRRRAA
ncbi:MAG: ferritin-like domain-containing protein [Acidobacteria bacterium]|nr:ferritin-like domain-containing protein [Acidobacteriota bacterium]